MFSFPARSLSIARSRHFVTHVHLAREWIIQAFDRMHCNTCNSAKTTCRKMTLQREFCL